jgi:hypothetical protein
VIILTSLSDVITLSSRLTGVNLAFWTLRKD